LRLVQKPGVGQSSQKRSEKDFLKYWREHHSKETPTEKDKKYYLSAIRISKVGDFGMTDENFEIFQILDSDEMIIARPIYVNERVVGKKSSNPRVVRDRAGETLFHIKGFLTRGLADGMWVREFRGVAVIGTWQYTDTLGSTRTILNCIPLGQVRKGLTIEQFKEMLKLKGIEEDNLSELVKGKEDSEILDLLEKSVKEDNKGGQEPTTKEMTAKDYYDRALDYNNRGYKDEAIKNLTTAMELKPDYAEALLMRGKLYAQGEKKNSKDFEKAIADFTTIIGLKNCERIYYCEAYYLRAITRERSGDLDGALSDFQKLIELQPRNVEAHLCRARIFEKKGEPDKAAEERSRADEITKREIEGKK
jgi:hypothetical protein